MKYNNLMKKYKTFIFSFLIILAFLNFKIVKIQGNSMYPVLESNSFALADKYLHKLFTVQKEDILLLEVGGKEVVKKIVGFPGERIVVENKIVKLENDEIFVMGENLPESIDSREYGPIKISNIIGKIVLSF
jgi:signal peptidase I